MQQNNQNRAELAKDWVLKAQNDLKSAEILSRESGPTDSLCFHCHQASEKILKGFLVYKTGLFPRIHDLLKLLNLCKEIDEDFNNAIDQASFLNRYYTETRYPSEVMTYDEDECKKALEYTNRLSQFVINKIKL